jgi:hypothetical protein
VGKKFSCDAGLRLTEDLRQGRHRQPTRRSARLADELLRLLVVVVLKGPRAWLLLGGDDDLGVATWHRLARDQTLRLLDEFEDELRFT